MRLRGRASLLLLAVAIAACGEESDPGPPPPPPGVALVVDGLEIRRDEIAAFDEYFDALDATMGLKYRTRELLDRHLIPLALARREFAAERAEALQRAEALAAVAGNHHELATKGEMSGGSAPEQGFARNDVALPVARWAFADEHVLQASPPIETPRGYEIVATREIEHGLTRVGDRAMAFLVPFHTHPADEFDGWLAERKRALAGRVEYVAPELEGALPRWLMP